MSKKNFPAWRYHSEFAPCIFNTEEELEIAERAGWVDSPAKIGVEIESEKSDGLTPADTEGNVNGPEDEAEDETVAHDETDVKIEADLSETMEIVVPEDLSKLTVPQLRKLCKDRGLTNYSKLREKELIALLEGK